VIVNLLVLAAIATVAAFGVLQRLYRATQMLVALILAGALASTLAGPVAGAISASSDSPDSTWYYVGDAICLWAILCAVLLGLRTAGHRLLPTTPSLPTAASQAGGAVVGAMAGYLAVRPDAPGRPGAAGLRAVPIPRRNQPREPGACGPGRYRLVGSGPGGHLVLRHHHGGRR